MGNAWFGFGKKRSSKGVAVVHPVGQAQGVTIKVRMTKRQLKDLMENVDMSSNLGRLIVEECSKGRLHARVANEYAAAAAGDGPQRANEYARGWGLLRPIQEHGEE